MSRFGWVALSLCAASVAHAQGVSISSNGIVNSASFAQLQPVSPGSIVAVFASGLGSATAGASSIPLSTSLANVSLTFNGIAAPLYGVFGASNQLNAQVPWDVLPSGTATGSVNAVLTVNNVSSSAMPFQIAASQPGIFTVNAQGTGQAAVTSADGSAFVAPAGLVPGAASRPAHVGDVIVIYANGLGPVDASIANGDSPHGRALHATTPISVLIGGVAAQVQFAGLNPADVGLNQINAQIMPGTPSGDAVSIQIRVDSSGFTTSDRVTIAVGP